MIRNDNFLLREVAGSQILVPVGAAVETFSGIVTLNASGVHLWNTMETEQTEDSLVNALQQRYDVSGEQASADVEKFVAKLRSVGAIKE